MAFQTPIRIKEALDNIHRHRYALDRTVPTLEQYCFFVYASRRGRDDAVWCAMFD